MVKYTTAIGVTAGIAVGIGATVLWNRAHIKPLEGRLIRPVVNLSPEAKKAVASRIDGDNLYYSKPKKAAEVYKAIIADHKNSKDPHAQDEVATAHIRLAYLDSHQKDFEGARKELAAVTTNFKGTNMKGDFGGLKDQAAYQSAASLMGEGKKEEAKTALLSFLRDYGDSPLVYGAHNRLRVLGNGDAGTEADDLLQKDIQKQEKTARFETSVCGPKAIAQLLHQLGKPEMDYEKIAKLCGTTDTGTTVAGMRKGLKTLGFESFAVVLNRADFQKVPTPSIWLDGTHYLLVLKVDGNDATVFDPFMGGIRPAHLPNLDDPDFQASMITLQMPVLSESQPS
jgi:hypothetical protein